jgi:FkbM family methyltransferase
VEAPPSVSDAHRASGVKVYAFEPSIANFKWLSFFFNDSSVVNLTNAAVSYTPGTAYFPNDVLGKETGKVVTSPQEGYVPVKIVSLDAFLGAEIPFIDVLSTDAEGFDQDVAKGARSFISSGRVGVYQFEMYRQEDYKTIFEQLLEWGYVCYYFTEMRGKVAGQSVPWLIRISECWHEEYQRYIGWVNGLCYNWRVPHLKPIFEALELRRHRNTGPSLSKSRARVLHFMRKYVNKSQAG